MINLHYSCQGRKNLNVHNIHLFALRPSGEKQWIRIPNIQTHQMNEQLSNPSVGRRVTDPSREKNSPKLSGERVVKALAAGNLVLVHPYFPDAQCQVTAGISLGLCSLSWCSCPVLSPRAAAEITEPYLQDAPELGSSGEMQGVGFEWLQLHSATKYIGIFTLKWFLWDFSL